MKGKTGPEVYPQIGDVFKAKKLLKTEVGHVGTAMSFSCGEKSEKLQEVAGHMVTVVRLMQEKTYDPHANDKNDANDLTRERAEFVIETMRMEGGGFIPEHGGGGSKVPSCWHVYARRLKNGKYDPKGEVIAFPMFRVADCNYEHGNSPSRLVILRKMRRITTFVDV